MSLLSKLLGRNKAEPVAPMSEVQPPAPRTNMKTNVSKQEAAAQGKPRWLTCNGIFATHVMGEQYHRENLEQLCGPSTGEDDLRIVAQLIPEKDNPFDANAVRVDIEGLTVGHLSREDALVFRKRLRRVIEAGRPIMCEARVRRNDRGNRSYYEVYLEADLG